MPSPLTIPQLAERCRAEIKRYRQTGQADDGYCLELFRRALVEQNQAAWQAIHLRYRQLVATWVYHHSQFSETEEEIDFFVNEAFGRLWQYGTRPETTARLDTLGKCLQYLKLCAGSAIVDYLRGKKKDALAAATPLADYDRPHPAVEAQVDRRLESQTLERVLTETLQDNRERLVAEESWVYGLAPRQIHAQYPDRFTSVAEVSQIKRNIVKRLKRRLT